MTPLSRRWCTFLVAASGERLSVERFEQLVRAVRRMFARWKREQRRAIEAPWVDLGGEG